MVVVHPHDLRYKWPFDMSWDLSAAHPSSTMRLHGHLLVSLLLQLWIALRFVVGARGSPVVNGEGENAELVSINVWFPSIAAELSSSSLLFQRSPSSIALRNRIQNSIPQFILHRVSSQSAAAACMPTTGRHAGE